MRSTCLAALGLVILSGCREKTTSLAEPLFMSYYGAERDNFCEADSGFNEDTRKGTLLLNPHNKALYSIRTRDSIFYYRGTYRIIDNGVFCNFDAKYDAARKKTGISPGQHAKNADSAMVPVRAWHLNLLKTGCSDFIYYSESGNLERTEETPTLIYRESDTDAILAYLGRINAIPALKDFHGQLSQAGRTSVGVGSALTAPIEKFYTDQYKKSYRVRRIENDSLIKLSVSYKRAPKGESAEPFLYISIFKHLRKALKGDLNGDGQDDLVLMPRLTQGGSSTWPEFFAFLKTAEGYQFKANASGYDLAVNKGNSHSGVFQAREITNGSICGTSLCYHDDDASCCPSVKVATQVKLHHNKLRASRLK